MMKTQPTPKNPPFSFRQLTRAVKRHANAVGAGSTVLTVLGVAGISLLPNVYWATTTILVDPQKIPEKYVSSTVTTDPNARMNTLTQQVLSASRLQEIVEKNNLYPERRKTSSREEVLDFMRKKTKIELKQSPEPEQGLSSFSISYEDGDRFLVARITNQLASSFIAWNLRVRQQQASGTTQFLSSELQQAKASLEQQEGQLEAFKMKHVGATPDELNGNLQALSRLQSEIQAKMDAISRLDQERIMLAEVRPIDLQATPLTERDHLLQEKRRLETERWTLKRQFTDTYPDVIAVNDALATVNARLAETEQAGATPDLGNPGARLRLAFLDKELKRYTAQLAELQGQTRTYQWKVDSVPVLQTQLVELTRNYDASKENYQSLLDKTFSAGMSEELERQQQAERFTVLDPARTPERPVSPKRLPLLALALVLSILLPSGAAFAVESLDGVLKSEEEVRLMLPSTVPILGAIPTIVSSLDRRRAQRARKNVVLVSGAAFLALAVFLFKIRPIL